MRSAESGVSRVLFAPEGAGGHSSWAAVADSLQRPKPGCSGGPPLRPVPCGTDSHPYSVLLQAGFSFADSVTGTPVRSCRTVSRLPGTCRALFFLWHCPWGRPRWTLSSALPYGARTFLQGHKDPAAATRSRPISK